MFIQWRRRAYKNGGEAWYAYLCESKRVEGKPVCVNLGYLGSIASEDVNHKQRREAFWTQARENLAQHHFSDKTKAGIEDAISRRVPKKCKTLKAMTSNNTEEWYTPSLYIDMVRSVLGAIDLDPASNDYAQEWIQATRYFTVAIDGLDQHWHGKIWLNPPYCHKAGLWTDKAIAEFHSGRVTEAIILVNQSGAAWYHRLDNEFLNCKVSKRISFIDSKGNKQSSPTQYNSFFYLGANTERFREVFSSIGGVK